MALAAVALGVSACGGGSTPTSATSSGIPDPCTIVSVADVTTIIGSDPGTPTPNAPSPEVSRVCLFSTGLILEVADASGYDQAVAQVLDPATGATTQELTGVGDAALLADYGAGISQVVAR